MAAWSWITRGRHKTSRPFKEVQRLMRSSDGNEKEKESSKRTLVLVLCGFESVRRASAEWRYSTTWPSVLDHNHDKLLA